MMTGSDSPEDFEAFAISTTPSIPNAAIAPNYTAPQHGRRPLPLYLKMLWQQTRNDTDFRLKAFAGLHKYQTAHRVAHHVVAKVAATDHGASLLPYCGTGTPHEFNPSTSEGRCVGKVDCST